jgi:hypothetical protein
MDHKTLISVTAAGTVAQLGMILAGHFVPMVRDHVFAVGGMLISLIAGGAYVRLAGGGWGPSLLGGAIVGGVCALIGILVSAALRDVQVVIIAFGTCASVVAGLVGGALARLVGPKTA